jgi:hypothetical protein
MAERLTIDLRIPPFRQSPAGAQVRQHNDQAPKARHPRNTSTAREKDA